jgi:hypothetical protein
MVQVLSGIQLEQARSRLTAYAARHSGDRALPEQAWAAFREGGVFLSD